jgi:Tol biopolymer transport system component
MKNASKQVVLFILISFITTSLHSQDSPIGIFKGFTHVNNPDKRGIVGYDKVSQEYMIEGASGNMWNDIDDFHFLWKKLKGDFILRAQVELIGKGVDPHRKVGWMVRHSLEANSPQINAVVHGDGLTSLQFRKNPGGVTEEVQSENKAPDIVQLERKGDWYIMSTAKFGEPFVTTHFRDITLGNDVYVGIFLCSHNEQAVEKAIFRNVRIIVPAKADFVPYRDYIGSHIEVMDIQNGHRKILYSEPVSLQAPNWTVDGKSLIYNSNGLLYKLNLQTNQPEKINTDFATRNNNDHVLSFDGKMLGISHHSAEDEGKSMVYTVPTTGGVPKKITTLGPSYLHGWSPDKKYLIYTGGRDNQYDIYRIPANGGKEKKLTISKGLDDGSEYTPDGKYIYYNSTETGRMQIWRMRANGTKHEQITNDDYNNWFPHISPDGKWIVFLSYMNDVRPDDHPFYKHVYLRLMPAGGGTPKVIAYIYGGQGTINVPSWSPDSKMVAFVSNTEIK